MSDITINFDGDDVIIRGPKSILKISIDPNVGGVQRIIEPTKPVQKLTFKKPAEIIKPKAQTAKKMKAGKDDEKRYYCVDCKNVFLSKASKLDAICPKCGSIHIGYASQHNR
ncbi:MAG: hypothetical protein ACYDH2_17135 [Anaerolineaceae bacterium]